MDLNDWDITAANNGDAVPDGWPEGMNYSAVNDVGRENMAVVARFYKDINGSLTTAGAADAYTLTLNSTYSSYFDGMYFAAAVNASNTGATTINVNSLGVKSVVNGSGSALASGDLIAGQIYVFRYDGTDFHLSGALPNTVNRALNGTLGATTPAAASVTTLDASGIVKFNSTNSMLVGTPSTPNVAQKGWGVIDNASAGRYVAASTSSTGLFSHYEFYNPNGTVGSIQSNGSATSYNTSSDPELKSEFLPIDHEWAAHVLIQSVEEKWVGVFHFLADKAKTLVAGYNAWKLIDNIPGYGGSERHGPRDMKIGEVYEPAVTEIVDGKEVEISPEKRVSPAGVDQSKLVPLLHAALYNALKRIEALEKK